MALNHPGGTCTSLCVKCGGNTAAAPDPPPPALCMQILPLQLLSLLVIPVFWTLPRLADLQLATTVAVMVRAAESPARSRSAGSK